MAPAVQAHAAGQAAIVAAGEQDDQGRTLVDILMTNDDAEPRQVPVPAQLSAILHGNTDTPVTLDRAAGIPATVSIAPGGFVRLRYAFVSPQPIPSALISIPAWGTARVALAQPEGAREVRLATAPNAPPEPSAAASDRSVQSRLESGQNSFAGNFSSYQPTYIAFGTAKDSEWRVQLSFKYRLLGTGASQDDPSWRNGLYFGFTNRLLWDIASDASFRDANYMPELFYRTPAFTLSDKASAGLQFGIQHESNGRSGDLGRSANNIYIAPTAALDLGNGYSVAAAPRVMMLIGGKAGNPDILKYRGATSLDLRIGKDDGLILATSGRYNVNSGKGALSSELSYPLTPLWGESGPNLYLFVHNFVGYGESLLDYNRRMTRLRIGVAITR